MAESLNINDNFDELTKVSFLPELKPGSIVLVTVGIPDFGNGQPPWIPDEDELDAVRERFQAVLPDGVKLLVEHIGVDVRLLHVKTEEVSDA